MKLLISKLCIQILRIIYLPIKCLKIKKQIVYISRQFNYVNIDFKLLIQEIERRYPEYKNVVLTKKIEKGVKNKLIYMLHMLKQMYYIATSQIVILDSYCIVISVLKHKKRTKIIQIWHAMGAIKKFGYQTIGKKDGTDKKIAEIFHMHKNYTYVLAPSEITKESYCKAFGVEPSNIKLMGLPRVDYLLKKKDIKHIYEKYPWLKDKENILYVPTFRKGKKIGINKLIEKFDTSKYNLIIKLHPLDKKKYEYFEKDGVLIGDEYEIYELFDIANRIITDYSSLIIDTALINKPLYFYVYDLYEYEKNTGLNFKFKKEPIGRYMAYTPEQLMNLLKEKYDMKLLKKIRDKYVTVDVNNCTERLSKFILEGINSENKKSSKENYY